MAVDFEPRLDSALDRIAEGKPSQAVVADVPEAAELLVVAEELRMLAPAPPPDLAAGRARFLHEAAKVRAPRPIPAFAGSHFRMALAAAVLAVLAIVIGNLVFFQQPSSVSHNPTFTATPTRLSLVPETAPHTTAVLSYPAVRLVPVPMPVPVPDRSKSLSANLISSTQSSSEWRQCRS